MRIVGLGHYSRTGKDTFAGYLIEALQQRGKRAKKLPFAWKLKQVCHELYGWMGLREPEYYDTPEGEPFRDVKLQPINKTPVEIWVAMGTPAVRQHVYDGTWIDYVLRATAHDVDVLIVPDVRFLNEVNAVLSTGGLVVKVVRPGYGPRDTVADRALATYRGWDAVIGETGKLSDLQEWAGIYAECLAEGREIPRRSGVEVQVAERCQRLTADDWAGLYNVGTTTQPSGAMTYEQFEMTYLRA